MKTALGPLPVPRFPLFQSTNSSRRPFLVVWRWVAASTCAFALFPNMASASPADALPAGRIPAAPTTHSAPSHIPAAARVPFLVAKHSVEPARTVRRGCRVEKIPPRQISWFRVPPRGRGCLRYFVQPSSASGTLADNAGLPSQWGVVPLRLERITGLPTKPALEIIDLWVDTRTLGMRERQRMSVPLALLAPERSGRYLYGFRQGVNLGLVLVAPRLLQQRATQSPKAGGVTRASVCGHLATVLAPGARAELDAELVLGAAPSPSRKTTTSKTPLVQVRTLRIRVRTLPGAKHPRIALDEAWVGSARVVTSW